MSIKKITAILLSLCVCLCAFCAFAAANARGDVNGDNSVNAEDARLCLRQAVGLENFQPGSAAFAACDVTGEGQVTAEDARMILRAAVGLETFEEPQGLTPDYTANNEYDIYRSGTFYISGEMTDSTGTHPLEIGKSGSTIYMRSDMEEKQVAVQVIGKDLYMILPEKNVYFKMDQTTLDLFGLKIEDLALDVNMGDLPALSQADTVIEGLMDGKTPCRIYTYVAADGARSQIYMDKDRFLGMDNFTANWVRTESIRVNAISKTLPNKVTTPGAGCKRVLLLTTFMTYFI